MKLAKYPIGFHFNMLSFTQNACNTIMERLEPYIKKNPKGKWQDWVGAAYFDRVNLSATGFYK
jgi:aldehyde oxidase